MPPPNQPPDESTHAVPIDRSTDEPSTIAPLSWVATALLPSRPWPVGLCLLDDFEVEAELGKGGMGAVYRVRQMSTGQRLAVKRTHLTQTDSRRLFLAELQTWLDLPDHPNLAPCRFFRSLGDEVIVFTDLAEAGSLADAIREGRFRRVPDLLDLAIQTARGLHALHERGLVHKDVKPANVLLDDDGTARLTDFGLARARARVYSAETGHSVLVSTGGLTPAYCSPEQAAGRPVSRKSDIWSWGLLVLELFSGCSPVCELGTNASEALDGYLAASPGSIARMPADVVEILRLCFVADPAGRWANLAEASAAMEEVYRDTLGRRYPRPAPPTDDVATPGRARSETSGQYDSPRKWLALGYREAGRDPTEADDRLPPPALTRRAQVVADLSVFDEARTLFRRLIDDGRDDLRPRLAALQVQQGLAHIATCDWGAAVDRLERAAATWQELVHERREQMPGLLGALLHAAHAHRQHGDLARAIENCDRVIRLWERLDNRRARRDLRDDLAAACLEKGLALRARGDGSAALPLFERAIELWRQMVEVEEQDGLADDLAQALLSQASLLSARGRADDAIALCDEAIKIRRRLVHRDGRGALAGGLARAYIHKANALRAIDEVAAALPFFDQAIDLLARLIDEMDRDDLAPELARAYMARGNAERRRGDPERAAELCAESARLLEQLVHREGRRELTGELARAYLHRGNAIRAAGRPSEALPWCDRAVELWRRLVEDEGRGEWAGDLARGLIGKANSLRAMRQFRQSLTLYDRVIEMRQALMGSGDGVAADLARDRLGRGELLVEMGERERAREELNRAAQELDLAWRTTPRGDLGSLRNRAQRLLRDLEKEATP